MAKLINGNGNPAIYAAEDADLIASLAGNVTCISNVGNKYAATEEDATTIRLDDGVIITKEGRRIQLESGESDTFYIPTGTSGQTNYYIIGYKLVQNADSTQVAEQFVQKMNSSSETITEDTFRSGATEVYVSVYRVTQVGFTIDSISGLLPELLDNASINEDIDQINSDLSNLSNLVNHTDYVEVTSDGVKTWKQILDDLWSLVNTNKIKMNSVLVYNNDIFLLQNSDFSTKLNFVHFFFSDTQYITYVHISYNSSTKKMVYGLQAPDIQDQSSTVLGAGTKVRIYY